MHGVLWRAIRALELRRVARALGVVGWAWGWIVWAVDSPLVSGVAVFGNVS
jgi:hypothetical protein